MQETTLSRASFECLPAHRLIESIKDTVQRREPSRPEEPGYTLILGAGFSAGIIPTTHQMMWEEIGPWADGVPDNVRAQMTLEEKQIATRAFWKAFRELNPKTKIQFHPEVDVPAFASEAYQLLHHGDSISGLNTPERAHDFMDAMNHRGWFELNGAHFFLSALLEEQRLRPTQRPFCRVVFTTNFDPLLQTGLQLFRQLYFMTDGGELRDDPGQLRETPRAIHLIYTHGFLQRPDLASTVPDIEGLHGLAEHLAGYLQTRGVIVIGSGGWNDCLMKALRLCPRFARNLYWCNHYSEEEASTRLPQNVKDLLGAKPANRFYVPLVGGADGFMAQLYRALYPNPGQPSLLHAPLTGLKTQINSLRLDAIPLAGITSTGLASSGTSGGIVDGNFAPAGTMGEMLEGVRFRLDLAERAYQAGRGIPQPAADSSLEVPAESTISERNRTSVLTAELQAYDAHDAGDFERAIKLLTSIVDTIDVAPGPLAKALTNRGFLHRAQGRHIEALKDYSQVIEHLPNAPVGEVARALFNRAVLHVAQGRIDEGFKDYTHLIEQLKSAPKDQIAKALLNRGVLQAQQGRLEESFRDYSRVIQELHSLPVDLIAGALLNRGVLLSMQKRTGEALADFTKIIDELPNAPLDQVGKALLNRGGLHQELGRPDTALADYNRIIDGLPSAAPALIAGALVNRGTLHGELGHLAEELADYTRVIEGLPACPVTEVARALKNRALVFGENDKPLEAVADYTRVIEGLPGLPADELAEALINRGVLLSAQRKPTEALADYTRVIEGLADVSVDNLACALVNRGALHEAQGRPVEALADYARVIEGLPNAPVEQVAKALVNRGMLREADGRSNEALADFKRVIEEFGDVPVEANSRALLKRAALHRAMGKNMEALADLTRVIDDLPDAPIHEVAQALVNRGVLNVELERPHEALKDFTRVAEGLPDAPVDQIAMALRNRGVLHGMQGRPDEGLADCSRVIESLAGAPSAEIAAALGCRGWLLYKDGKGTPSEFLNDTLQATNLRSDSRPARTNLGLALLFAGQDEQALAAYKALMLQSPPAKELCELRSDIDGAQKVWLTEERARPILALLSEQPPPEP